MTHLRTLLLGSACAVLLACTTPTDSCACPPGRAHGVIYGSVHSPTGEPVAGAEVVATVYHALCGTGFGEVDDRANPAISQASGAYRLQFSSLYGPQTACVRVSARGSGATDSAAAHVALTMRSEQTTPDSVRVDFVLP